MTEADLRGELLALKSELDSAAEVGFNGTAGLVNTNKALENISRAAYSVFGASAALKRVYTEECAFAHDADAFLRKAEAL